MADAGTRDPDTIEREVERTQDDIGDTVDQLEERLDPSNMAESLLGEDGRDNVKMAWDVARRNPLPVAMIVVGTVWLFATSDSPPIRRVRERLIGRGGRMDVRSRSEEPAPIGPPPETGGTYDRRRKTSRS